MFIKVVGIYYWDLLLEDVSRLVKGIYELRAEEFSSSSGNEKTQKLRTSLRASENY